MKDLFLLDMPMIANVRSFQQGRGVVQVCIVQLRSPGF